MIYYLLYKTPNIKKIVCMYRKLQGVTGVTVVTGVYKRLQGVAGGYKNSIGLRKGLQGLKMVTRGYRGLKKRVKREYRGLQKVREN